MLEFGVSLSLGITVCMIYKVKQNIRKCFKRMEPDLKSFGFGWIIGFEKLKKKNDKTRRGYGMIGIYFFKPNKTTFTLT